ncbi:MAG: metalloregulator ArsR/SmtB family transcription factor [bacterium]|nr:metalloregulator ArsR/SmtB family transcription factor [bacterium]
MRHEPSGLLKALSVETRVKIIELLKSKGPLGVNHLAQRIGVTPAAISQHLKILKMAGLVRNERKGTAVPYSLDEPALQNFRALLDRLCSFDGRKAPRGRRLPGKPRQLASLRQYERKLQSEIKTVRRQIRSIRTQKGKT